MNIRHFVFALSVAGAAHAVTVPSIGVDGAPFTLSLSGWQFRVGVSFGL